MKRFWKPAVILLAIALALVLSYFAQFHWYKNGWPIKHETDAGQGVNISPVSRVLISEVMSSNKTAHVGVGGLYSDWVEIYNSGNEPCDITGWTLTDDAKSSARFTFPKRVLNPGEFAMVYLTDVLDSNADRPYQAPFKLSSQGDALLLYDESGSIMEAITIPALPTDASYARIGSTGEFIITKLYTPGLINTNDSFREIAGSDEKSDMGLRISKVCPDNGTLKKDAFGKYSDFIEIKNVSQSPIDLSGCLLSDDMYNRGKWTFPNMTLGPNESVTVYATGASGDMTAPFKLSAEGETVVLCDDMGRIIDSMEYGYSLPDQVWER